MVTSVIRFRKFQMALRFSLCGRCLDWAPPGIWERGDNQN